MALIIFLGIYLGSALILSWIFIEGYKYETEQNKVTIQEYCRENEELVVTSFFPIVNTVILILGIISLILYPLWALIRKIKI